MGIRFGDARCSTGKRNPAVDRQTLLEPCVPYDLGQAYSESPRVRSGDALVAPQLDRLAPSVPHIGDNVAARPIRVMACDPIDEMFLDIVAAFAAFEVDVPRLRAREGMAIAGAET